METSISMAAARQRKPLKVGVWVVIEVDREAYDQEYGERASAEDIRAHVKGTVLTASESAFQNIPSVKVTA